MIRINFEALAPRITGHLWHFFDWWGQSLWHSLPRGVQARLARLNRKSFIDLTQEHLHWRLGFGDRETLLATTDRQPHAPVQKLFAANLGRRPRTLTLRLDPALVFQRDITLPLAAEKNLSAILKNEIDRVTPFETGQAYFDHCVIARDKTKKQLTLRLAILPKATVDGIAQEIVQQGIVLRAVKLASGSTAKQHSFPASVPFQRWSSRQFANASLILLCLVASGVLLSQIDRRLDDRIAALTETVRAARNQASQSAELRKRIAAAAANQSFFEQKKAAPSALLVINDLTKGLSDDIWISQFQMTDRDINLSGFSRDASQILTQMEHQERLKNARFRAPVTRSGDWDRFELTAVLAAGKAP